MNRSEKYFRWACLKGLHERVPNHGEDYRIRLDYELDMFVESELFDYFLVLAYLLKVGRERGLTHGPGRGSTGGSLATYCLYIHDLDPIVHNLVVERFYNPARKGLFDIDIDVPETERSAWLELIRELYGDERVASIGTYGTIGAKAALKDANRVLGGAYKRGEELTRMLPPAKFGRTSGLDQFTGDKRDPAYNLALGLEGVVRQKGQHAAGVIISPEPLSDLVPLWHPASQDMWVTENDMHELDEFGLIKYDFLGLRNLDVINETLKLLGDKAPDLPTSPEDCNDEKTYQMLSEGKNKGVFQVDSNLMRGMLMDIKPDNLVDLQAILAIGRPGPMSQGAPKEYAERKRKNGRKKNSS